MNALIQRLNAALARYLQQSSHEYSFKLCGNAEEFPQTWQGSCGQQRWALRVFDEADPTAWQREIQAWQLASRMDVASKPLWVDDVTFILILPWLPGRILEWRDYSTQVPLSQIINLLRFVHQTKEIDQSHPLASNVFMRIEHYFKSARHCPAFAGMIQECETKAEKIARMVSARPVAMGFIHNDSHAGNFILQHGRLQLIDWSEAGWGDVGNDLAEILILFPQKQHSEIGRLYFGEVPSNTMRVSLTQHWLLRLALFSAWGFAKSAQFSEFSAIDYQPVEYCVDDEVQLLQAILSHERLPYSCQDYLNFAMTLLAAFNHSVNTHL